MVNFLFLAKKRFVHHVRSESNGISNIEGMYNLFSPTKLPFIQYLYLNFESIRTQSRSNVLRRNYIQQREIRSFELHSDLIFAEQKKLFCMNFVIVNMWGDKNSCFWNQFSQIQHRRTVRVAFCFIVQLVHSTIAINDCVQMECHWNAEIPLNFSVSSVRLFWSLDAKVFVQTFHWQTNIMSHKFGCIAHRGYWCALCISVVGVSAFFFLSHTFCNANYDWAIVALNCMLWLCMLKERENVYVNLFNAPLNQNADYFISFSHLFYFFIVWFSGAIWDFE